MQKAMIKFWGVRGSLARPGKDHAIYGGNTPCVEIRCGKDHIICDTGTGICDLGHSLTLPARRLFGGSLPAPSNVEGSKDERIRATILYTHYHWDHMIGLPFFAPIYNDRCKFVIMGRKGLKKAINALLHAPNFPVKLKDFGASIRLIEKKASKFKVGRIQVEAFDVNHPNGAFGYRFTFPNKKSAVFISDNGPSVDDRKLIDKIYGADILIHDAQYLPDEFIKKRRFGHSTFQYVLDISRAAKIKHAYLFHHDPSRTDKQVRLIETSAQKLGRKIGLRTKVSAAREGLAIWL